MGSFRKHLGIAREKMASVSEAYCRDRHTVVDDLATRVVEQLVEADAARASRHFGTHKDRHDYSPMRVFPGTSTGPCREYGSRTGTSATTERMETEPRR